MAIKRQQIIDILDAKLRAITIANGYHTNAGNNVYAWLDRPMQPSKLPAIVYRDAIVSKENGAIGTFRWSLQIEIAVFAEDGVHTASTTRKVIADVLKAVGAGDAERWGGNAEDTILGGSETAIERHDKIEGASVITINIIYDAPMWEI